MSVNFSSNSSLHPPFVNCLISGTNTSITAALFVSYMLLLPLFILVLYVGCQRWRKQRSVATAAVGSHSDIFTFNMVVLELISVLGLFFYFYGTYTYQESVMAVGMNIFSVISHAQALFHLLVCVEHYLAVIHPVTYLGLRQAGGVRIRNISIGCGWLLCCGSLGLSELSVSFNIIYCQLALLFSSIAVSFCSLSVLCVLIRPGPGEVGGNRERVDQSKQRALHTIMAIMAALLLRFLCTLVSNIIYVSSVLSDSVACLLVLSSIWFSLPSSLVLPLLFLRRAGKLPGCKHNTASA